ncbi:MAG: acyl-ACP--UDP-N-acetylglucosamine O-acyltransferase [Gammaproteobacteria bacterium]|nr:acyl-ACP--UDP-N-acetylglucosamine O-acyltransferase [Gammaproteobacteria bacterium]MDH4252935.1 acyl-ACP--UDP-N-acetylglucosamine O-acyltransferase [Gammaproteobacteria bacterium]MDH5308379.1 acyl-ACP--UDP-N-acetylglucosamine O-acyltransferase [Gammaproteobacteria bacterium]
MSIHPTAIVAESAKLAADVEIGPFTIIGDQVEIDSGTRIDSHVVINGPTRIGRDNHIYQFASIGDDPQDKKYADEPTRLEIGDRNTIREYCTISRGTVQDQGITSIGNDNWIMAYVHIAHDCRVGNNTIFANNATLAGHVTVGDWVIFAGFSGAHQFCHVGAHSFLGMYSGTNRDVPAYTMVAGQPAEPRGINSEGLKRRNFSAEQIRNIKNAYRVVYRKGLKLTEAIEELETLVASQPELRIFIESLQVSERGILR